MRKFFFISFFLTTGIALLAQTSSNGFVDSGIQKQTQKDFNGAISDYSKAIGLDAKNGTAYYNKAVCEINIQLLDSAIKDFSKTIELDTANSKAFYNRAKIYIKQKNIKKL